MNRAVSREVFIDIVKMIRDYAAYFAKHGEDVNGNATQGISRRLEHH